ncbi:MAG: hypothetical protein IT368_18615 [Candidatus Hydrogenedentes bacterium]|nr:hypothetical protein [Candidatus Hydrogenedentota bacterium]
MGELIVVAVIFVAFIAAVMVPVALFLMLMSKVRAHQEHQERLYAELQRAALEAEAKAQERSKAAEEKEQ